MHIQRYVCSYVSVGMNEQLLINLCDKYIYIYDEIYSMEMKKVRLVQNWEIVKKAKHDANDYVIAKTGCPET